MKELRDLKDVTIHDVQPVSDEQTTGRRRTTYLDATSTIIVVLKLSYPCEIFIRFTAATSRPETEVSMMPKNNV